MISIGDEVKRCFLLGANADEASRVVVDVAIAEDGSVRTAKVLTAPANKAAAVGCAEKALLSATFGPFCGDDVSVRWTYALQ